MRITSLYLSLVFSSAALAAQETPTERQAARDVLRKLAELEASLDVPGLVKELTRPSPERDRGVARARELMDEELLAMSDAITRDPEIGFVEHRAVERRLSHRKAADVEREGWEGNAQCPDPFGAVERFPMASKGRR